MHIYHKHQQNNKHQNPFICFLVNCISARSTLQILRLKEEYTLCFFDFPNNWFA